jgi:hypothetical protein
MLYAKSRLGCYLQRWWCGALLLAQEVQLWAELARVGFVLATTTLGEGQRFRHARTIGPSACTITESR